MKLNVLVFGLIFGWIWAACVFLLGVTAAYTRKGAAIVRLFAKVYLGFNATLWGGLVGAVWGFVDGAISGMLMAWVLNKFVF